MTEVAYNLENFAAKTAEQQDKELKSSSLRIIKNRRKVKVVAPVKVIFASALAIVISVIMIYSQVVLTELTSEVSFYENQLTELNTEYVRLQGELEATTSIKTLEEAAETKALPEWMKFPLHTPAENILLRNIGTILSNLLVHTCPFEIII